VIASRALWRRQTHRPSPIRHLAALAPACCVIPRLQVLAQRSGCPRCVISGHLATMIWLNGHSRSLGRFRCRAAITKGYFVQH